MVKTSALVPINEPQQAVDWSAQEMSAGGARLYASSKFAG
jgi:hypothetical protein